MRRVIVCLALLALISGCTQPQPQPTTTASAGTTTETLGARAELPQWNKGQGWTYVVEVPGQPARTFVMMVAEEREDLWVVASNDRQQAVHHVLYSTNPVLGRIGKQTLAPFQSGAPVDMYRFPLLDGKRWTAPFFGEEMQFQATYAGDISLAGADASSGLPKRVDGFRIVAQGPTKKVSYDYVDAVEWFTSFEVVENGNVQIRLSLRDIENDYRGKYYFYRGAPESESLVRKITSTGSAFQQTETLDAPVPDRFKDGVALGVVYTGKPGTPAPKLSLNLKTPSGASALTREFVDARQSDFVGDVAGVAGTWKLDATKDGSFEAEVRVVGFSKFAEGTI